MIARHIFAASLVMVATPVLADTPKSIVPKPAAIVVDGPPPVTEVLATETRPYLEARRAVFQGWNIADRSILVKTRFGSTDQLHVVAAPQAMRRQVSFEQEPILAGFRAPGSDGTLVIQKDVGGAEFFQLYRLEHGRLVLLTDGKSRNWFGAWSPDGRLIGYTSTRRNGTDSDIYVMDPRKPGSDRLVAQVDGGGWSVADFSTDGKTALILNRKSINNAIVYELDLTSGKLNAIAGEKTASSYVAPHYAPDGKIWVTSSVASDFLQLGTLDRNGHFASRSKEAKWDVSDYAIAPDGSFIAYAINEAGISRLRVMDVATGVTRPVAGLPAGVIPYSIGSAIEIAPWGAIGLSISSARVAGDVFSVDPATLAVTRWTESETGGLDAAANVDPKLVEVKSFDGETVSGFLYRPDPTRFPGRRPLVIDIHGGPEGQSRPDYRGADNYLLNDLGIALFYPNVRGSTGFGKRFVNLDNGPDLRENSVKDIGAMLDALGKDNTLDPSRFAVSGMSYGGYMCYASAVHYSPRIKSASCYVGISNFVTFLESTQSYRRDLRRVEYGDERDPKQRAKLIAISPLTSVDKISVPILIATGGNDPRVPASEAEQIIKAIRSKGGTAWHLLAQNEGHGFHKKENEDYYFWSQIQFWKQTLLGDGAR